MLAIDTASSLVPVVVTTADFAATGHPFLSVAHHQPLPAGQPLQVLTAAHPQPIVHPVNLAPHVASLKRGSDELLSHSSVVANGTGMSPTQMDSANDAKKVKVDPTINSTPSRVLHFRGIPQDTTEGEIVQLGMPFGRMTNLVLAKKKNQALLEMGDVPSAQAMVNYYSERPPNVRGRTIYVQFSNHVELKTEQSSQNAGAQAALQAANQLMQTMDEPRMVLRVIVENMLYPVTIDVLKQIFSRFGQVIKIVTFSKNATFQALIQYSEPIAAQTARGSLNGQNIYNGCCTLRIDFSKLQSLNVKYNNDKSRDYTNPSLPTGDGNPHGLHMDAGLAGFGAAGSPAQIMMPQFSAAAAATPQSALTSPALGSPAPFNPFLGQAVHQQQGGMQFYGAPDSGAPANYVPSQTLMPAGLTGFQGPGGDSRGAVGGMMGSPAGMGGFHGGMGGGGNFSSPNTAMPFGLGAPVGGAGNFAGLRFPGAASHAGGTVLLVSNLNEENVTPDALFTLFGVYGDVIRVKIMFNKKDNALVQFTDPSQANTALTHLDKIRLWGKQIKIAPSKHSVVQLPKEGQPDAGLTKDFSNSPLHRFKKPNSKNFQNIYPPSPTLHLSNIPPTTTEDTLVDLFKEHGNVEGFKFFQKDRKMALIQMSTVEEAIEALIATHNHQLAETSHLRVSFSKSTIRQTASPPLSPEQQIAQAHQHAQQAALAMAAAAQQQVVMVPQMI